MRDRIDLQPAAPRRPRRRGVAAWSAGGLVLAGLAGSLLLERSRRFDVPAWLAAAEPGRVHEVGRKLEPSGVQVRHLAIDDRHGRVHATLRLPAGGAPRGGVVLLGGRETGRDAVQLVPENLPFAVAALDYAYDGPARLSRFEFLCRLPGLRRDLLRTTRALHDLARHVGRLPELDRQPLYVLGASLGTPFAAAVAAALRPDGLVVVYGFADHEALIESRLRPHVGSSWVRRRLARWGDALTAGLDARRTLPRLCGVPVLVIGSDDDSELPAACRTALWQATCEPRRRIVMPGGHIRPRLDATLERVTEAILAWVEAPSPVP